MPSACQASQTPTDEKPHMNETTTLMAEEKDAFAWDASRVHETLYELYANLAG